MTPIAQVREALLSRLRASVRGVPVLRLLDLVDGDELRLAAVIWRLTVAGDLHLTYATEGMPERTLAGTLQSRFRGPLRGRGVRSSDSARRSHGLAHGRAGRHGRGQGRARHPVGTRPNGARQHGPPA